MTYYVLDDAHQPVATPDYRTWGRFFGDVEKRRVAATEIGDGVHVSTVFLGMDHAWGGGTPLLFESMVFEGKWDQYCWRYCTWDAAKAGHEQIVAALQSGADLGEIDPATGGAS